MKLNIDANCETRLELELQAVPVQLKLTNDHDFNKILTFYYPHDDWSTVFNVNELWMIPAETRSVEEKHQQRWIWKFIILSVKQVFNSFSVTNLNLKNFLH